MIEREPERGPLCVVADQEGRDVERRDSEEAAREAWSRVMDGVGAALQVDGLASRERARLVRCYRNCAQASGRSPLGVR